MRKKIQVDVIVDIVCPWCYVGKKTFLDAVESSKDQYDFEIRFRPFQLDPNTPKEGMDRKVYLTRKFGSEERFNQAEKVVTQAVHEAGGEIHFEKIPTQINTMDCHRLIWWTHDQSKQIDLVRAIYQAYFVDGVDLSKTHNLLNIAANVGLDREILNKFLRSEEGTAEVKALIEDAYALGVTGVPFYIFNQGVGVSGAQPKETFLGIFNEI